MWYSQPLPILRELIGDSDASTYSDFRLQAVLLSAGHLLLREVSFDNDYVINIGASSILPDPSSPEDVSFINLLALRGAVLVTGSEWKSGASQAIVIKDGPSTIDTSKGADALKERAQWVLDLYTNAKNQYVSGNSIGSCIVSGPIGYWGTGYRGYYNYKRI